MQKANMKKKDCCQEVKELKKLLRSYDIDLKNARTPLMLDRAKTVCSIVKNAYKHQGTIKKCVSYIAPGMALQFIPDLVPPSLEYISRALLAGKVLYIAYRKINDDKLIDSFAKESLYSKLKRNLIGRLAGVRLIHVRNQSLSAAHATVMKKLLSRFGSRRRQQQQRQTNLFSDFK